MILVSKATKLQLQNLNYFIFLYLDFKTCPPTPKACHRFNINLLSVARDFRNARLKSVTLTVDSSQDTQLSLRIKVSYFLTDFKVIFCNFCRSLDISSRRSALFCGNSFFKKILFLYLQFLPF